jgi:helix-turn-helix protein
MRGRYPTELEECIDELDGASEEKQRLKVIFATASGESRLFQSCAALGIGETRFRQLRRQALQWALDGIKPKAPGRPSRAITPDAQRVAELERLLAEKDLELQQALVREEVALILPHVGTTAGKKTPRPSVKLRKQKPR